MNFFSDYNCLENIHLRTKPHQNIDLYGISFEFVKIARTFSKGSYFDFIRFFNLINFIFGYRKPLITRRSDVKFFITRVFRSKFLYFLLRNLFKFRKTAKGSFLTTAYFENGSGFIKVREPHVAFSVTSPYFDYHNSVLNLAFTFSYKKNPQFLHKLIWIFGFLRMFYHEISAIHF